MHEDGHVTSSEPASSPATAPPAPTAPPSIGAPRGSAGARLDPIVLEADALLFDMDGTLVDSTAVVESNWRSFAERYGVPLAELLGTVHGRKAEDTVRRYGPADIDVDAVAAQLIRDELTLVDGIVEIPGARRFIRSLPFDRLALVTSAPRELAEVRMRLCDIPWPAVVVAAEDVTNGKPDPEPYLSAAAALGTAPDRVIVFEDADAGLASARAAGMRAVVIGGNVGDEAAGLPRIVHYDQVTVETTPAGGVRLTIAPPPVDGAHTV